MAVLIVSMDIHGMDITGVAYLCAHSKICKQLVFQCTKGPTYTGIEESWPRGGATS